MKKLLLISVVLFVAGLGLILYSDPIVSLASGNGPIHNGITTFTNTNGGQSSGGPGGSTIGPGVGQNITRGPGSGGFATSEYLTIAGIAFAGAGVFLTGVEAVSRSSAVTETKTVT